MYTYMYIYIHIYIYIYSDAYRSRCPCHRSCEPLNVREDSSPRAVSVTMRVRALRGMQLFIIWCVCVCARVCMCVRLVV